MRLRLDVLMGWCRVSSLEVNGEKCGVMHMKRKGIKRTEEKFYVGGCHSRRIRTLVV